MSDFISRETALDLIDRIRFKVWLFDIPSPTVPEYIEHHEQIQHMLEEIDAVRKEVEQLPGIDERKTGTWIIQDTPKTGWYRMTCSECGENYSSRTKPRWEYCPRCGVRMEGETE